MCIMFNLFYNLGFCFFTFNLKSLENICFLWSLWRCLHAKRFRWSVSPYRTTVLASPPPPSCPEAYFGCLAQDLAGLLSPWTWLVQFLPQQNLVVYFNTLPSLPPHTKIQKSQAKTNWTTPELDRQKQVTLLFGGEDLAQSRFLFVSLCSF